MGRPKLQWSPIPLRMENHQKIIPMGRFQGISIDIDGSSMLANFEVIDIIDDSYPYPTFLGFDWAYDIDVIINLKKTQMIFEIIVPELLCTLKSMSSMSMGMLSLIRYIILLHKMNTRSIPSRMEEYVGSTIVHVFQILMKS